MEEDNRQIGPGDEHGLALLEEQLVILANTLEDLSAALAELLAVLRQRSVQLQLALDLRASGQDNQTVRRN